MKVQIKNLLINLNKMKNYDFSKKKNQQIVEIFIKNNLKINKIIFKESLKINELNLRKFFFYSLINFIYTNLKNRRKFYILFYLLIIKNEFFQIIKVLYSSSKVIVGIKKRNIKKNFIISYGFPRHAFNLSKNKCDSYAGLLETKYKKFSVISVNEYINKNTFLNKKLNDLNKIKSKKRDIVFLKFSIKAFIKNFYFLITNYSQIKKKMRMDYFIIIEILTFKLREIFLKNIIQSLLKERIVIKEIHLLPFNNFIFKDNIFKVSIKNFMYGDNISEFSVYDFKKKNNINELIKYIPFNNFAIRESCVGINYSQCLISRILSKKLNFPEKINNKNEKFEYHNLGFSTYEIKKKYNREYLALFDSPPKKDINILSEFVSLNLIEEFIFFENFFYEVINSCYDLKIKILFKPKYIISSNYYSKEYCSLVEKLTKKYHNIEVVDPYDKISKIIDYSKLSISYPGSTSLRLLKSYKIKSFYFIPSDFVFLKKYMNTSENIFGVKHLRKVLSNNF